MPSALLGSILAIAPLAIQVQITGTQARVKVQVVKNWNSPCEHSRSMPSLPSSPSWEPRQLPSSPSLPWCELLGTRENAGMHVSLKTSFLEPDQTTSHTSTQAGLCTWENVTHSGTGKSPITIARLHQNMTRAIGQYYPALQESLLDIIYTKMCWGSNIIM